MHLNALVRVTPLVGGYLKAYAQADSQLAADWNIKLHSEYVGTPASEILHWLVLEQPDVVAFSVYSWNVRLIRRILPALRGVLPPTTQYLLGGVEIMNCASRYVPAEWENVIVCDGEGEHTFREYLAALGDQRFEPDRVPGISYARDGEWHHTTAVPRIADLSRIPSPWLGDIFSKEDMAEIALFETNRGCPFACEFCYWGGAVGSKVNRQELDRIKEEITYIANRHTKTLALCDANFGMLKRDVEIAHHIATVKSKRKAPSRLVYSTAKNNPDRVEEIARIFTDANLLHNQSISLQSLNPRALSLAKRSNIREDTYLRLQRRLNQWKVPSFIELIWPLPGETLNSFKVGIDLLCRMGAQSFTVYPLLWLNNVGYADKTEAYGVGLLREDDAAGEASIVIRTREVEFEEFIHGLEYAMSVYLLHNCRGLYSTSLLLDTLGIASFRQIFDAFVDYMDKRDKTNDIELLWRTGKLHFEEMTKYIWRGAIAYSALHSMRESFDRLLSDFLATHSKWLFPSSDPEATALLQSAFEFDLLNRPYPFVQTPFAVGVELQSLEVHRQRRGIWTVDSPYDFPAIIESHRTSGQVASTDLEPRPVRITIDHRCRQVFRVPGKREEEHYWHMHQAIREIGNLEPVLDATPLGAASTTPITSRGEQPATAS